MWKDVPLCQSWGGTHSGFTSLFFSCWASEDRGSHKQSQGFEAGLRSYMKGFALNFFLLLWLFKAFLCTSQLNQNCILLPPVPGRSFLSVICQLDSILVVLSARSDSLTFPQKQTHPIAGAQGHFSHHFFCPRHVRMHIYMYTYTSFFPPFWPRLLIEFAASRWQHKTGNYSPIIHFTAIVCEPCLLRQFPAATSIAVQEDAPWAARTDEEGPPSPGTPGLEIAHFWPWCIRALHSHRRRHKSAEKWNFSIDGGSVSKLWLNFFISLLVSIIYVDLFCVRAIYLFIWGS